jgi:hypothetical protein
LKSKDKWIYTSILPSGKRRAQPSTPPILCGLTSYRTELYLDGFWDLCNKLFKLSTECKSCKQVSIVGQVSARDITSVKRQPYRAADFGATLPTREGNL